MESRGAYFVVSVCISLYIFRYINLVNFFGLSFGNFHRQDLFSLNLDLVYGGIRQKDANWRLRICFVSRRDTPTRTIAT